MSRIFDDPHLHSDQQASYQQPIQSSQLESQDTPNVSLVESFLNSFFQEKNIKWMLVVGAAIVFGSSLMLVTKAWPDWTLALKYLTILGYTGAIFFAAEVSRKRLRLTSTYRVLHALTVLLLPVSFLSLTWLTSGTAVQNSLYALKNLGLLLPAVALLWFTSTRIFDHWLRGRQTTFLVSFCLLCVAGALPAMTTPLAAFGFIAVCWIVFTAGVVKVNRHTFYLAEQHQLPRIFGFLPIVMLGGQFVVLAATKAVGIVPVPWIGFCVVMVSATVLMTARTVADVFRRRSGDLVRPLPWPIIVPLFGGLVLMVLGMGLSAIGFSYVGQTTYAIVPAFIVGAALFGLIAKDTRYQGFVWACLAAIAVAYQCSPTLFSNLVQAARNATADAINQDRVPFSMYGLTYLPLLGCLAVAGRRFATRNLPVFSQPIKQFVTIVAVVLFGVALSEMMMLRFISPFLVSTANVVAFTAFAIVFADRRYAMFSVGAFLVACATAVSALNQMQYIDVAMHWVPAGMAAIALLMTATGLPDRLINLIPVAGGAKLMRRADGSDRGLVQIFGCALAIALGVHWVISTAVGPYQPLPTGSLIQFGLLMAALVRYTMRNPVYLSASGIWVLVGYATVRWAIGANFAFPELVSGATFVLIGISVVSYQFITLFRSRNGFASIDQLRQSLGFDIQKLSLVDNGAADQTWARKLMAFTVPLFDLSMSALASLIVVLHASSIIVQVAAVVVPHLTPTTWFGWATPAAVLWLFAMSLATKDRALGLCAAMLLPLTVTATLYSTGFLVPMLSTLVAMAAIWCFVQGALTLATHRMIARGNTTPAIEAMNKVGQAWMFVLLGLSCLSFDLPMRLVALACIFVLALASQRQWDNRNRCGLAILTNINLFWVAAAVGGCSGWVMTGTLSTQAIPLIFLTGCISVLVFENPHRWIAGDQAQGWAWVLRIGLMPLGLLLIFGRSLNGFEIVATTLGFAGVTVAEALLAVRKQDESRVWMTCILCGVTTWFLFTQGVISLVTGISQFVLLSISIVGLTIARGAERYQSLKIFQRPMLFIGQAMPALVAILAVARELGGWGSSSTPLNSLSLMIAAGIYFHQAFVMGKQKFAIPALVITNVGLFLLWKTFSWSAPELYMVPVGLSILGFTQVMKKELPKAAHTPLHYIGLLTILCSPLLEVLGGSWIHILSLMFLSVAVILIAIGLRIRSLVYAGSAFLFVDLVAMVIRSTMHNLNLLWICGVVLGIGVIVLAAFCENHREKLLAQIRMVSAELATWN